ncbi:hypothetical protein IAD21_01771 [Abditibacteriota bacterium]|nr:hypothetical protein IAD21_01771 [Abditibacteriota bacterium]
MKNEVITEEELNELSRRVLGAAYIVANTLGCGFKEKVYENARCHELRKQGLDAQKQVAVQVFYDGVIVGDFICDILVEGIVLLELKAADAIHPEFVAQALNYLKATELPLCLILNFGTARVGIKRVRL